MRAFIVLFLILHMGCTTRVALKRDRIPEETVVGRFSLSIEPELGDYEGVQTTNLLWKIISAIDLITKVGEMLKFERDPAWKAEVDKIYAMCTAAIEERTGMHILPKETLQGKVKYDAFGYPRGEPAVLAGTGKYPSVLGLSLDVTFLKTTLSYAPWKMSTVRPQLILKLQLFDHSGKILWLDTVKAKAKQEWIPKRPHYYYTSQEFFLLLEALVQEALEKVLD